MTIRSAIVSDKTSVIQLLKQAYTGGGFDTAEGHTGFTCPCDPAYIERMFLHHINAARACCFVHDVDGVAQGVLMATFAEHIFSPVLIAKETVWWIDPSHRGRAAFQMMDAYEAWAKKNGCSFVSMASKSDPRVASLYERRGYRVAEVHHLMALQMYTTRPDLYRGTVMANDGLWITLAVDETGEQVFAPATLATHDWLSNYEIGERYEFNIIDDHLSRPTCTPVHRI